jgi:hypothetical protein
MNNLGWKNVALIRNCAKSVKSIELLNFEVFYQEN